MLQPLTGVPGQKFTGVARPSGDGVLPPLSAERLGAVLRSGAQGHEDVRWIVLAALSGV